MAPSSQAYPGNKSSYGSFQNIINHFPPHVNFISACGGSGSVEFRKKLAPGENIACELSQKVIDQFWNWDHSYKVKKKDCIEVVSNFPRLYPAQPTLIYWDPPYLHSERSSGKDHYEFEWTEQQHKSFLKFVKNDKALHAISHYKCDLYDQNLKGWNVIQWQVMTHTGPKKEALYMNYPAPKELHQYDYLGNGFTDRQRIKRKKERFIEKIARLPELERHVMISALKEYISQK